MADLALLALIEGDEIIVTFDDATTLTGQFQGFRRDFQFLVLDVPTVTPTARHYILNYNHFSEVITP